MPTRPLRLVPILCLTLACSGNDQPGEGTDGSAGRESTEGSEDGQETSPNMGTDDGTTGTDGLPLDSSGSGPSGPGPDASDDVLYVLQDAAPLVVDAASLLANDTDAVAISDVDPASAAGGQLQLQPDGSLLYTPPPGYWGSDAFEYTAADTTGATGTATVTVYVAPVVVSLDEVAGGHGGFVIEGEARTDGAGSAVASAGDFDGDGLADIVVGASNFGAAVGRAYVVLGRAETSPVELSAVAADQGGLSLTGVEDYDFLGTSVSSAGDVDGDGLADVVVGASSGGTANEGRAFVVLGKGNPASLTAPELEAGTGGFAIRGEPGSDQHLGMWVAGAGDVNGDGHDDVIVGARWGETQTDPGRAYVVFGRTETTPIDVADLGNDGFVILPGDDPDPFLRPVAAAGDVNGDGLGDLLVAGPMEANYDGALYVVFGKATSDPVDLANLADGGFVVRAPIGSEGFFGIAAAGLGDWNGDGLSDILAARYPNAVMIYGKTDAEDLQLSQLEASGAGAFLQLPPGTSAGNPAAAGDINGDGLADAILGPYAEGVGRAYVVFGRAEPGPISLVAAAAGEGGFVIDGEDPGGDFDWSVSGAGDVDGNGLDDLVVGNVVSPMLTYVGRAHVVFSVPRAPR